MTYLKWKFGLAVLVGVILMTAPVACSTAPRKISEPAAKTEKPAADEKDSKEITPTLDDLRGYLLPAG